MAVYRYTHLSYIKKKIPVDETCHLCLGLGATYYFLFSFFFLFVFCVGVVVQGLKQKKHCVCIGLMFNERKDEPNMSWLQGNAEQTLFLHLVPCKWIELASDYQRNPNHCSLKLYFSSARQMYLTLLLLLFCQLSFPSFLLFKMASFQN